MLSEQPPLGPGELEKWWDLYGGKPDLVGQDLEEVAKGIIKVSRSKADLAR